MPVLTFSPDTPWQPKKDNQINIDIVTCPNCNSEWFEIVSVSQYKKHTSIILGQKPVKKESIEYFLYRCIKCNEIFEPEVQGGQHDQMRKKYDKFLDHMAVPYKKKEDGGENV